MSWAMIQVAGASLTAGIVAGWLMHRADFCTVATFRDLFMFGDRQMLRAQLLLVCISLVLFEVLRVLGVQAYPAIPFFGLPSGSNFIGGVFFGFGMVLAGGCVVGVLYRLGSGSRLALVAFLGLLSGSAVYAEIHPWWAPLARSMRLGESPTLPVATGIPAAFWLVAAVAGAVWLWRGFSLEGRGLQRQGPRGELSPHHAALGLALCGVVSLLFVGMPLGVTTSYAKVAALLEGLVAPNHVAALDFFAKQPLTYTPPYSQLKLAGGGGPTFDAIALIQYPLIVGVLAGAALSAWRLGEFRVRFRPPALQVVTAFSGGAIMGLASRLTPGCNVWHLWGGLPLLALSSILFLAGVVPGAWFGTLLIRQVILHSQQKVVE